MKILVLNCGSSSLKCQLFEISGDSIKNLAAGIVSRIGLDKGLVFCESNAGEKKELSQNVTDHNEAAGLILQLLCNSSLHIIVSLDEIEAVGHRVVHGGEDFFESVRIDDSVIRAIDKYSDLAPLHNPVNKEGILACQKLMPGTPQVAVFDTAFHQTMKPDAYMYAIPYEYYKRYGIRRYGFHGTSHKYVFYETANFLSVDPEKLRAIICHIGNGVSITAVSGGRVVDTSMGFTPLEGLMMGTRSGDIDPSIILYLSGKENLELDELEELLNKRSGLLGISGVSSDMRDILNAAGDDDSLAVLALNIYVYRIVKYIGAYTAALNGTDAIVFTAGVGERSKEIRKMVIAKLSWLGAELDEEKNDAACDTAQVISTKASHVKVLVVPTDEEKMIAKDTYKIVSE